MRVYEKYDSHNFTYPDEMERILDYLNRHGTLLVKPFTVEKLYYEFSEDQYCASWVIANNNVLEEFADWLGKKEI